MNTSHSHLHRCTHQVPTSRCGPRRWQLAAAVAVLVAIPALAVAFPFQASTSHPRVFFDQGDVPALASRVGIQETGMPPKTVLSWRSHLQEWDGVSTNALEGPGSLDLQYTGGGDDYWSKTDARKIDEYMANQAVSYFLTQGQPEGATMLQRLINYMRDIVADARSRNGGSIGPTIRDNDWGKNAVYKGYCMAYDYTYPALISQEPALVKDYATWLFEQAKEGYEGISNLGEDITEYKHFYKTPWIADGAIAPLLTIWGDLPLQQIEIGHMIDYALDFKWEDYRTRALNYYGTYSGYREERVEEDLITAALISSCLESHDPLVEFADHFRNIDDWVMYMTRGDGGMSDETGDKMDLGPLMGHFKVFPYISASLDNDGNTLWFLDKMSQLDSDPFDSGEVWVYLLWNDKTIPRNPPVLSGQPLSRYFGDLTWDDGGNSQYAHFRSHWAFGAGGASAVMASFLCGPIAGGHDTSSNGHFAIFRGGDILTTSTGVYDGTAFNHTKFYNQPAISENTILIYNENSPYANDESETSAFKHTEGIQAQAPGTTGGDGTYMSYHPFDYAHSMGNVTKFAYVSEAGRQISRLECDITEAYPNSRKPDLWNQGGRVADAVIREFLFLSGKYFILYDRINTTSALYKKSVLIHSPDKVQPRLLDGSWSGGVQPHPGPNGGTSGVWSSNGSKFYWDKGASRLFLTMHLPSVQTGRRVIAIGGTNSSGQWNRSGGSTSYEYWLRRNGLQYPYDDQYLSGNEIEIQVESGWAGWWRLEIEPAQDSTEDRFLTLMEAAPKSQFQPAASERLTSDASTVALSIQDPVEPIVVALPIGLEPLDGTWYDYDPQGALPEDDADAPQWALHVVDGLEPGAYVVFRHEGDGVSEKAFHGTTTADGMLTFRAPGAGRFQIAQEEQMTQHGAFDELLAAKP